VGILLYTFYEASFTVIPKTGRKREREREREKEKGRKKH
jgi:hypothetical protein